MKIHASGEDYLEAVLILQKQMGESAVRSVDLARHMGFSKPSINHAVGVNEITAEEDACRIEHAISDESFQKLQKYFMKPK